MLRLYRALFASNVSSWNIRDQHMFTTVQNLDTYFSKLYGHPAKIVIWAHNSHLGDARATERHLHNEFNLGQLVTEHFSKDAFKIGFSTYTGMVAAASEWGTSVEFKMVKPALEESYEALFFHYPESQNFILDLRDPQKNLEFLSVPHLQRAIGVLYKPHIERQCHYYYAKLPLQFEAIVHLDNTRAIIPLDSSNDKFDAGADTILYLH